MLFDTLVLDLRRPETRRHDRRTDDAVAGIIRELNPSTLLGHRSSAIAWQSTRTGNRALTGHDFTYGADVNRYDEPQIVLNMSDNNSVSGLAWTVTFTVYDVTVATKRQRERFREQMTKFVYGQYHLTDAACKHGGNFVQVMMTAHIGVLTLPAGIRA